VTLCIVEVWCFRGLPQGPLALAGARVPVTRSSYPALGYPAFGCGMMIYIYIYESIYQCIYIYIYIYHLFNYITSIIYMYIFLDLLHLLHSSGAASGSGVG